MKARKENGWLFAAVLAVAVVVLIVGRTGNRAVEQPASESEAGISKPITFSRSAKTQRGGADLVLEIEKAMRSQADPERERVFAGLLASLVEIDPAAADALLARIEPGPFRDEYLLRLAQLWAARDARAALQWASALHDQDERPNALRSVCLEIAQADPESAIRTIENLGVPDDKSTLDNMAQLWASKDLSAATAWALGRPEGEQRDGLVSRIAYIMAEQDPFEAARLVVNSIASGEIQNEAAMSIVHRWALRDWNSAGEWVDLFPEGPLRERAKNELAGIKAYAEAKRRTPSGQ